MKNACLNLSDKELLKQVKLRFNGEKGECSASDDELLEEIASRFESENALLDEVEFLTKKMIALNQQIQNSVSVQSGFLSLIKNEFNNPMSVLLLLSKKLSQGMGNAEQNIEISRMLRKELLRLDFQLQNIFSVTEIEAGEIGNHYGNMSIASVFDECVDALAYAIDDKAIKIVFNNDVKEKFLTDITKVYRIIVNLLSNGIEFSFPHKEVVAHAFIADNAFCFEVSNVGAGMKNIEKKEIYNRFTRFEIGGTRESSGLGLGLSVAKAYVDALNGEIDHSCDGGLVKFWFKLPLIDEQSIESDEDDVFFDAFETEEGAKSF